MGHAEEKVWRECEPLQTAWSSFCDYGRPEWNRAVKLKRLRWVQDTNLDQVDAQLAQAERLENNLKREFLHRLHASEFEGFGRDITESLGATAIKLPASVFDDTHEMFDVDWDRSAIQAFGRHIIEIRVRPIPGMLEHETPTVRAKGGRPRKIDTLKDACRIAIKRDPSFCGRQIKEVCPVIEGILKTDLKTAKGFEAGVNPETLRRARKDVCGNG